MKHPSSPMCLPIAAAAFAAVLSIGGCDAEGPGPAAEPVAVHRYQVRGTVVGEPSVVGDLTRVSIVHEPIPGFRDLETGEVVGMPAMQMAFPLAEGLRVPVAGDEVAFTLLVDGGSHGGLPYVIESLTPAPEADRGAGGAGRRGSVGPWQTPNASSSPAAPASWAPGS